MLTIDGNLYKAKPTYYTVQHRQKKTIKEKLNDKNTSKSTMVYRFANIGTQHFHMKIRLDEYFQLRMRENIPTFRMQSCHTVAALQYTW